MALNWHVVRTLSAENRRRIREAKPGKHWKGIPKRLRPTCHQDRKVGFSNVYGRMRWDKVSPTITGGCTTFSKGRFGHPDEDRTISVYEAALLQSFPKNYVIDTPYMEYACNIIGNALPCDFAKIMAKQCSSVLQDQSCKKLLPRKRRHKK
jgi:DNA (cytosine-5)-methyltransferase 1